MAEQNIIPTNNLQSGNGGFFDPLSSIQPPVEAGTGVDDNGNPFELDNSVTSMVEEIRSLYKEHATDQPFNFDINDARPSILDRADDHRIQTTKFDVSARDLFTTTSAGEPVKRFESFKYGTDNEERLAQQQGAMQQWGRGIKKAGARFASVLAENTLGAAYGIGTAIRQGTFEALSDNSFLHTVEDWNVELNGELRNYRTHVESQMNFLEKMGTANFWADEFGQGMAFLSGMIVSEFAWAGLTGGASVIARSMKAGSGAVRGILSKTGAVGKGAHRILQPSYRKYLNSVAKSQAGKAFNNARFIMTSAGSEASLEAYGSTRETIDNYVNNYVAKHGEYPPTESIAALSNEAISKSNYVYATNLALVGASNILQFGGIFGIGNGFSKGVATRFSRFMGLGTTFVKEGGEVAYKAIKPSLLKKVVGTTGRILRAPITEGVVEEGLQGVISKTHQNWVTSQFDSDAFTENYGFSQAIADSFEEQYKTREGLNEVFLGMLIGAVGARGQGIVRDTYLGDVKRMEDRAEKQTSLIKTAVGVVKGDVTSEEFNALSETQQKAIKNLQNANRFQAFTNRANQQAEKGDFLGASLMFNSATFAKMSIDNEMGGVDQGAEDFATALELMDDQNFVELGLSRTEIKAYKEEAVIAYKSNVKMYKRSQDYIASLDHSRLKKKFGKEDYKAFVGNLHRDIFLGLKSSQTANELAATIDEFTGTQAGGALNTYRRLSAKSRRRVQKMSTVKAEMATIEQEMEDITNDIMAVQESRNKDAEAADSRLGVLNTKRAKLNEKLTKARRDYTAIQDHLNNALDRRKRFNGGLDALFGDSVENANDIRDADTLLAEVERFDNFRQTLKTEDPAAWQQLETLIGEYGAQVGVFEEFNKKVSQLEKADQLQPIAELFGEFNALPTVSTDELFEGYIQGGSFDGSQEIVLRKFKEMEDSFNLQKANLNTFENTRLEPISFEEYKEWKSTGEIRPETFSRITDKVAFELVLSPREQEMYNANEDFFTESIEGARLEMGDSLESLLGKASTEEEQTTPKTTVEYLDAEINKIKKARKHLDDVAAVQMNKEDIPTNKEFEEYEALLKESKKKLKPKRRQEVSDRLQELKAKLNRWGRLQGAREGANSIADLIEQKVNIEELEGLEEVNVESNFSDHRELDNASDTMMYEEGEELPFEEGKRKGNHDFLQTYDKAIVTKVGSSFEISNVSIDYLATLIGADGIHTVERKVNKKTGKISSIKVTNSVDNSSFTMRVGERGRIKMPVSQLNRLNATPIKVKNFTANNVAKSGGFYKTLLREVSTDKGLELLPIPSDFTLANDTVMNMEAVYSLGKNDSVSFVVDMNDPFNMQLLEDYNAKQSSAALKKMQDELVIYGKDKDGRIVGVFKSSADSTFAKNDNQNIQPYLALKNMRNAATTAVINDSSDYIDLEISIPVRKVFAGHPQFNLDTTDGTMKVGLTRVEEHNLSKISNVGFYVDGNLELKNKTDRARLTESPFGRLFGTAKFVAANKGKKFPVAVIEHKGRSIVYPVSLLSDTESLGEELDALVGSSADVSEAVMKVNEFSAKHGLNPNDPSIGVTVDNFESSYETVRDTIVKEANLVDVSGWMSRSNKMSNIVRNDIAFNIDINGNPFNSPKVRLDFSSVEIQPSSPIQGVNLVANVPEAVQESIENQKNCK